MYKINIKYLREKYELTQIDVAKILNIYKGLYNQYETEYEIIPIKHLNTLSNYYNVSLDYIFGFTNIKQYKNKKDSINKELSGTRLKNLRKEYKITQDKLAKILNVSRTTITEYERGTNIIATSFLYTLCIKYNISADYLLGKTDENKSIEKILITN